MATIRERQAKMKQDGVNADYRGTFDRALDAGRALYGGTPYLETYADGYMAGLTGTYVLDQRAGLVPFVPAYRTVYYRGVAAGRASA